MCYPIFRRPPAARPPASGPGFRSAALGFLLLAAVAAGANFPAPFDTEKTPGGPMPAAESAARVSLPPGFRSTVFAAEPAIAQPIAMATDARGRLWVAENYTYSERTTLFHPDLRDRIVVLEDTDNDGRYDRRTVFWEGAQRLTSIEVGLGGVWAVCLPHLLFLPDRNGDDVPDGPPEVVLDGFDYVKARHNVANGLRWGPDGWLYGRHGILGTSLVGAPGTAPERRTPVGVGIWRYHPQRRTFEMVADGTTNPWGMDWDPHGEPFFINTVIGHLWHLIPGAHYRRMFGADRNPRVYELIDQHADHVHWATGEVWTDVRKGVTDATLAAGGGHAHTGLLIYQGGQWPEEWNGRLLTVNFHGRRINVERLERHGSAIIGRREPDAFAFADPWFRGLDLLAAPDGGVFVSDWSDAGECHDNDGVHRSSGRIFKLTYGEPERGPIGDLTRLDGAALAARQRSRNDWEARQARRVLADRAAAGGRVDDAVAALELILNGDGPAVHRLRALWALQVVRGLPPARLAVLLQDREETVRAWAVRLLGDDRAAAPDSDLVARLATLAAGEPSARVRLALAALLQRLPPPAAARLAAALLSRAEDAADHNLPLMLWYGIEPLAAVAGIDFEHLAADAKSPRVSGLAARRMAEEIDTAPARLAALLTAVAGAPHATRAAVLDGVAKGLAGRRTAPKPAGWDALQPRLAAGATDVVIRRIRDLNALFGDGRALAEIRAVVLDEAADVPTRRAALQVLVEARVPDLREVCQRILRVRDLTGAAVAGLGTVDDPAVADLMLREWSAYTAAERGAVLGVLVSRAAWAEKLLAALAAGKIERTQVPTYHARQIRALGDPALTRRLDEVWGRLPGESSEPEVARAVADWQRRLTPAALAEADLAAGRALFQGRCGACHVLQGEGGAIGPDLTGAARDNLAYLLENILAPSAVVPDEYRLTTLTLKDGRVISGVIRERAGASLTVQSMTEAMTILTAEVVKQETSAVSLMPTGLLDGLDERQARDLFAYLMAGKLPAP